MFGHRSPSVVRDVTKADGWEGEGLPQGKGPGHGSALQTQRLGLLDTNFDKNFEKIFAAPAKA